MIPSKTPHMNAAPRDFGFGVGSVVGFVVGFGVGSVVGFGGGGRRHAENRRSDARRTSHMAVV